MVATCTEPTNLQSRTTARHPCTTAELHQVLKTQTLTSNRGPPPLEKCPRLDLLKGGFCTTASCPPPPDHVPVRVTPSSPQTASDQPATPVQTVTRTALRFSTSQVFLQL